MYINGSGRDYYEFYIQLNRCGTLGKNAISEKSRENPTVNIFIWIYNEIHIDIIWYYILVKRKWFYKC